MSSDDSMDSSSDEEQGRNPSASVTGRPAAAAGAGKDSSSSSDSSDSSSDSSSSDSEGDAVKPVTDARMVTLQLGKVNPSFTCKLCSGYFRDAHTLMDCLHTFWSDRTKRMMPRGLLCVCQVQAGMAHLRSPCLSVVC